MQQRSRDGFGSCSPPSEAQGTIPEKQRGTRGGSGVDEGGKGRGKRAIKPIGFWKCWLFQETQESPYWLSCVIRDLVRVFSAVNTVKNVPAGLILTMEDDPCSSGGAKSWQKTQSLHHHTCSVSFSSWPKNSILRFNFDTWVHLISDASRFLPKC